MPLLLLVAVALTVPPLPPAPPVRANLPFAQDIGPPLPLLCPSVIWYPGKRVPSAEKQQGFCHLLVRYPSSEA